VTARSRQRAATSLARSAIAAAAALTLAGSAAPARADEPGPAAAAARPHVEAGVRAYEAGDFAAASREFEAAVRIDPVPAVLYAWGQSLRQGGRCTEAIAVYRRYLATNPDELQAAAATTGIALCEAARPPPAPAPAPAPAAPLPSAAGPTDTPRRAWYHDPAGGALVIGGVAMAGIGASFFVLAERSIDRAEREPLRDRFVEQLDEATQRRRLGYAGAGLGAVLVLGGIVRYATRGDGRAPVAVTASPGMVSIHGSY
jgi:tetratricopeptide (TPR) repeat protein